jgi:hypothetical protein
MNDRGVKSVSCLLVVVFLGMDNPAVSAEIVDVKELQQPGRSSAAMAGFYTVTPEGETMLEDPLESGFATSAGSDFDPERADEAGTESGTPEKDATDEPDTKKKKSETQTIRIRVKRKTPQTNLADQFQCERHGFYYTRDGRCILPAYSYPPAVMPRPLPNPGMRPGMTD